MYGLDLALSITLSVFYNLDCFGTDELKTCGVFVGLSSPEYL